MNDAGKRAEEIDKKMGCLSLEGEFFESPLSVVFLRSEMFLTPPSHPR